MVTPLTEILCGVNIQLLCNPTADPGAIQTAVTNALLDPASALFGTGSTIGGPVYDSQIAAVCMSVPGVIEVDDIAFQVNSGASPPWDDALHHPRPALAARGHLPRPDILSGSLVSGEEHAPGEGCVFVISQGSLNVTVGANDYGLGP